MRNLAIDADRDSDGEESRRIRAPVPRRPRKSAASKNAFEHLTVEETTDEDDDNFSGSDDDSGSASDSGSSSGSESGFDSGDVQIVSNAEVCQVRKYSNR